MRTIDILVVATMLLIVTANRVWGLDPDDKSGGHGTPTDKAQYPKAFVHGITALALTLLALVLGGRVEVVAVTMAVGMLLYEWSQRWWRTWDIVGGFVGTFVALLAWRFHA